jgi:hypothetical protein
MGYNIVIGNAEVEAEWVNPEYVDDGPSASWVVKVRSEETSPYFSDSGHFNERSPTYSGWEDFTRKVGLYDWFYNKETGKRKTHPGCAALTKDDVVLVKARLDAYKAKHPKAEPVWCECKLCDDWGKSTDPHNPNSDGDLLRLTWLTWWVNWAVENCERPAIYNS